MNHLSIKELSKKYANDVIALSNISLEIGQGMFGLLGPNGSGKSTLMKTIVGLQEPTEGTIHFNGENIVEAPSIIKNQVGYLPQDFGVYPNRTAYELMNHLAILKGVTNSTNRKTQILSLLEKTNLFEKRNQAVSTFSGGMRQRFGIAQALLGNPQIIIVDEPTAGLDPEERNRFNNLLSELGENIIVILATHIVEDVRNLCAQMAIIENGVLLKVSNPSEALQKMTGKIWTKRITKNELLAHQEKYDVLSTQLTCGALSIRVFDDTNPLDEFEATQPILEDVYFHSLSK